MSRFRFVALARLAFWGHAALLAQLALGACGGHVETPTAHAQAAEAGAIARVLLVDVAGLREEARAEDAAAHPSSALARLASRGTTYAHARGAGEPLTAVFDLAAKAGLLESWGGGGGATPLLNAIQGENADGSAHPGVPALFGARIDAADAEAALGAIVEALAARDLAATTLLVVTSSDEGAVPLVLAGAGARRGVVEAPVSTRQVAPTIAVALGLDPRSLPDVGGVRANSIEVLPSP